MKKRQKPVATLTFNGERHEDHTLQIDDLPELIAYRDLLVATAREVFLRENPDRTYVPKGFADSIDLRFGSLGEGSTAVPLLREVEVDDESLGFDVDDEVDRAARIIDMTTEAASENRPLPDVTPASILPLFERMGRSLGEGESIRICAAGQSREVVYTPRVRDRLATYQPGNYEDAIDLEGEVRAADLDGHRFVLRYDGDRKVEGVFPQEMEEGITQALRQHETSRLCITGRGIFAQDGILRRVLTISDWTVRGLGEDRVADADSRPIWETLAELGAKVSDGDWATVADDLSTNLDAHLYHSEKPLR